MVTIPAFSSPKNRFLPILRRVFALLPAFLVVFLQFVSPRSVSAGAVTLSLDPATATVEKGASQTVDIVLDSGSQPITVGDIYLEYDDSLVSISQSDISKGEQGYDNGLCDFRLRGVVVNAGVVRFGFSCEDDQGNSQPFQGQVVVGKVTFTALADSGDATLSLKYIEGATAGDCNVAYEGKDYLTGTAGGSYSLAPESGSPTHQECVGSACVSVDGAGDDACSVDSDCVVNTYLVCENSQCVSVEGEGSDDSSCAGKYAGASCSSSTDDTGNSWDGWDSGSDSSDSTDSGSDASLASSSSPSDSYSASRRGTTATTVGGKGGGAVATSSAVPHTAGGGLITVLGGTLSIGLILGAILLL